MPDFFYGGQALIEGVMMRGRTTVAMSVRPPSGEIRTMSEPLPAALSADRRLIKMPLLRGVFVLYETLVIGTRMLMRSAAIAAEGEDIELGKGTMALTMVFSLGFAIGLFFLLPLFLSTFAEGAADSDLFANAIEGLIRLVDLHRLHRRYRHDERHPARVRIPRRGAQGDQRLRGGAAADARRGRRFGTAHTRCGTTFLLIVVVISIFFFSLIPRAGVPLPLLFLSRIVLVPVIAAVAYELVRFGRATTATRWSAPSTRRGSGSSRSPLGRRIAHAGGQHRLARVVPGVGSRGARLRGRMIDRLAELEARYEEIGRQLLDARGGLRPARLAELGRELSRLEPMVAGLRAWRGGPDELERRAAMARRPRRGDARDGARGGRPARGAQPASSRRAAAAAGAEATRTTSATSSSRSAPAPAATRPRCSPPTCSACTPATPSGALAGRGHVHHGVRGRRLQGDHLRGARRRRVLAAEVRERRPPRAARPGHGGARAASTPRPRRSPCCPRRTRSRSRSTRRTCASTSIAPAAPAARA